MLKAALNRNREAVRFSLAFVGYLAALALVFSSFQDVFARFYLKPTTIAASFLLRCLGVEASPHFANLPRGFCDIALRSVTYRVTHRCTGIFICAIFTAGVLAYPASGRRKMRGLAVGIPAFFAFGAVRLVFMGLVAAFAPDYIALFHRYIMVMFGAGFALFLWMGWVDGIRLSETCRSLPA